MRWATFPKFEQVEYPNGQQASFWPADAEAAWRQAGLQSPGEVPSQQHCTVDQAVAEAMASAVSLTTGPVKANLNPKWHV